MGPGHDDQHPAGPTEHADALGEQADDMHAPNSGQMEDYLRLHEHVERLRADQRPTPPGALSPEDARAYQMAALFRAAAPDAAEPTPQFTELLRQRLEREMRASPGVRKLRAAGNRVSRRSLLAGGISAATAATIGLAAGAAIEAHLDQAPAKPSVALVTQGDWQAVAAVEAIPLGGVRRFATDAVVGFVRHTTEGFSALSGACTHMGCLLAWNNAARTFDCPCHGGRFTEDGASASSSPFRYSPLPAIQTKVEGGQVWVFVPASPSSGGTPTPAPSDPGPYSTARPDRD